MKKKPHTQHYLIYIRPIGSAHWYQHCTDDGLPYRTANMDDAHDVAKRISETLDHSAMVVTVTLPAIPDTFPYASIQDGQTMYIPAKARRRKAVREYHDARHRVFIQQQGERSQTNQRDGIQESQLFRSNFQRFKK